MHYSYKPRGVCSRVISFDVDENDIVTNLKFDGGCHGNTQGLSRLVEGMKREEVIRRLSGIDCRMRGTSCPDQLSKALSEIDR